MEALSPLTSARLEAPLEIGSTGVTVTMESPLHTAALPVAVLPDAVSLALYGADGSGTASTPFWEAEAVGLGRSVIELGDDYALGFNTIVREVVLANRKTKETTRIFGEAQIDAGTDVPLQFWGTTSFALENGILITANTVQSADNAQAYRLDKLTVEGERRTLVITGLSAPTPAPTPTSPDPAEPITAVPPAPDAPQQAPPNIAAPAPPPEPPPLIVTSYTGRAADVIAYETRDGLVLEENAHGAGWISEWTDAAITQADLDETAPGQVFGPDSQAMSLTEFSGFISRVMTSNFAINMASTLQQHSSDMARESRTDTSASRRDRESELRRIVTLQSVRQMASMRSLNEQIMQESLAA